MRGDLSREKASRNWKKNHPEWRKHSACAHRIKMRRAFFEMYGHKCACPGCNETLERFLTIDHVNNDGAQERKGKSDQSGILAYREALREYRPDKYQVLCYNCNCGKRDNGGTCPHLGLHPKFEDALVPPLRKRKLTWEQVKEIRSNSQGMNISQLAKQYGVSYQLIIRVKHNKLYKQKVV